MAEADPVDALRLAPGERVLWQGRPQVGAPLPDLLTYFLLPLGSTLVVMVLVSALFLAVLPVNAVPPALTVALGWLLVVGLLASVVLMVLLVSWYVGPYYVSILVLLFAGPGAALAWVAAVQEDGWVGAVARVDVAVVLGVVLFIAAPLGRIAVGVTGRLAEVVVITDRRVAGLRAGPRRPRVLWVRPLYRGLEDLRLVGAPDRKRLAIGARTLHLRDVDPEALLADLRAAATPRPGA